MSAKEAERSCSSAFGTSKDQDFPNCVQRYIDAEMDYDEQQNRIIIDDKTIDTVELRILVDDILVRGLVTTKHEALSRLCASQSARKKQVLDVLEALFASESTLVQEALKTVQCCFHDTHQISTAAVSRRI